MVGRRNGPEGRMGASTENDAAQIGEIDGHGNGFTELGCAEPLLLVLGQGSGRNLVEPQLFGIEARASIMGDCRHFFLQTVKVFGIKSVDQMNFATSEPK